jgi:hypothetical protein
MHRDYTRAPARSMPRELPAIEYTPMPRWRGAHAPAITVDQTPSPCADYALRASARSTVHGVHRDGLDGATPDAVLSYAVSDASWDDWCDARAALGLPVPMRRGVRHG